MEDISVLNITLGCLDKGVIGLSIHIYLYDGTFGDILNTVGKFQTVKVQGQGLTGTSVQYRRYTTGTPNPSGRPGPLIGSVTGR
jgi:hypothetical protein